MKPTWLGRLLAAAIVVGLTVSVASADEAATHASAKLTGFQEVPPKLTNGMGTFSATVQGTSLTYKLTYSGLSTDAFMAHIHFAQPAVNGGIFLWLCGSAMAPGPAGTLNCPPGGGTVTRTITAADIVTITPDQGVAAGDFAGAVRILQSGDAYVNVHTIRFPAGEIRGQVHTSGEGSG
jgi:CHRD domain-containing protein